MVRIECGLHGLHRDEEFRVSSSCYRPDFIRRKFLFYLPNITLIEKAHDGAQLYRHLLHRRIPRLAFAEFHRDFLHVPGVEVTMVWLSALLRGDLALPSVAAIEQGYERHRDSAQLHRRPLQLPT